MKLYNRTSKFAKTERNNDIYKRRNEGETYASIAKFYNISNARTRQIYNKVVKMKFLKGLR